MSTRSQDNTPKVKGVRRQGVQSRSFSVGSTGVQSKGGAEPMRNKDGSFNDTGARGLAVIQRQAGKCIAVVVKALQNHKMPCSEVQIEVEGTRLANAPRALKFAGDIVVSVSFRTLPRYSKVCAQVLGAEGQNLEERSCIVEDLGRFLTQEFLHKNLAEAVSAMVAFHAAKQVEVEEPYTDEELGLKY